MLILKLHGARLLPFNVVLNIFNFTTFSKQVKIEEFHSKRFKTTISDYSLRADSH